MTDQIHTFREFISDPDKRFKEFFNYNCDVKLNTSFSIDRYLRSGRELIRMANIYFQEQDYFHSFVLYSRYIVLFSQVIKTHPQYKSGDKNELISINNQLKNQAFPRAEKLKVYIKDLFKKEFDDHEKHKEILKLDQNISKSNLESITDDIEHLKHKYQTENQNELNNLIEKEKSNIIAGEITTQQITPKKPPVIDRSLKPGEKRTNNYNFRTILTPFDTIKKFLEIAEANTIRNIETCGILAGRLSQNKFILSHIIIPKQKGTSDTCSTEQEHELFDVIDSLNLITLGWIHTHPSQTAFLSSIDLHTHFGYQLMIPEAIAIVCAPSYDQYGIFILNPDFGLKEISECNLTGFHPHSKQPQIFEECDHALFDNNSKITIIDLRIVTARV